MVSLGLDGVRGQVVSWMLLILGVILVSDASWALTALEVHDQGFF